MAHLFIEAIKPLIIPIGISIPLGIILTELAVRLMKNLNLGD